MFKKLKTLMFASDIRQADLCRMIGVSQTYLTSRMTGKNPFSLSDVYAICEALEIPHNEIVEYFPDIRRVKR